MKKRIFSGIQPTGNLHIGNYLAAIRHWVAKQVEFENIFSIVDLHAITVTQNPQILKAKIREVAALLFALGIDPKKSTVFVQSDVTAHAEMAWILNCLIPMGWMYRMTQFKEKSEAQKKEVSVGLFDYPALMAADILLYETDIVPVGHDQKQHVELTRDVAQRFNSIYGETFKLPEPIISAVGSRIMGLDNPMKKMSKSKTQSYHAINILDSPDDIRFKIMRAVTDSSGIIVFDENRHGIYNLLVIFELFTGFKRTYIESRFEGKSYADFKRELAEIIIENLRPVQSRYHEFIIDPSYVDSLLKEGASRVRPLAEKTLNEVRAKVGIG